MNNPPNPDPNSLLTTVGRISRFYTRPAIGLLFSLWTYGCGLWVAAASSKILAVGTRELVVLLLPLMTLLLVVGIIYFLYRDSDEYIRQRILKSAALTAVILAFSASVYFSLERLGFPHLSMIVVIGYGWAVFAVQLLWVLCRAR